MNFRNLFLILSTLIAVNSIGQKIQTKEIKINYSNGTNVFNVCITNPSFVFDKKKEYYWYSEISDSKEIKSTEGGCGGNLLNGKNHFFDINGNLMEMRNFNLGLVDGESKYWDSTGSLWKIYKYNLGNLVYRKWKVLGGWFEDIGTFMTNGYIKRNYDEIDILESESIYRDGKYYKKDYHKYSKKIQYQYCTQFFCDTCLIGKFSSFYENGNKKAEGQYSNTLSDVKVGIWKFYKENGLLEGQETYKEELQKWSNGKWKKTGGYLFDTDSKKWVKNGKWDFFDEDGNLIESKIFDLDIEVK